MKEIVFGVSAAGSMYIAGIPKEDVLIIPNNFYYGSIATHTGKISSKTPKKKILKKALRTMRLLVMVFIKRCRGIFRILLCLLTFVRLLRHGVRLGF